MNVVLIGKAGAGKTTAAELLVKRFDYQALSNSAPLKIAAGTSDDRERLQDLGEGLHRLCPDFLVNNLIFRYHNLRSPQPVVVEGVRYPNELYRLGIEGFTSIRVVADDHVRLLRLRANGRLQDEAQLDRESETALNDYMADYTIVNNDGPDELLSQLTTTLNRIRR